MPTNMEAKIECLERQIWSKRAWLDDHGSSSKHPRPEHERETKAADAHMLEQIKEDYVKSLERSRHAKTEDAKTA